MFCNYVRAILHHREKQTNSTAHVLDLIEENIEQDFNESILIGKSLIANNRILFESSRTYLHFLQSISKGKKIFTMPTTEIISNDNDQSIREKYEVEIATLKAQILNLQRQQIQDSDDTSQANALTAQISDLQALLQNNNDKYKIQINALKAQNSDLKNQLQEKRDDVTNPSDLYEQITQLTQQNKKTINDYENRLKEEIAKLNDMKTYYESNENILKSEISSLQRQLTLERDSYNTQLAFKQNVIDNQLTYFEGEKREMIAAINNNFMNLQEKQKSLELEWQNNFEILQKENQQYYEQYFSTLPQFILDLKTYFEQLNSLWNQMILQKPEQREITSPIIEEINDAESNSNPQTFKRISHEKHIELNDLPLEEEIYNLENTIDSEYLNVNNVIEIPSSQLATLKNEITELQNKNISLSDSVVQHEREHHEEIIKLNNTLKKITEDTSTQVAELTNENISLKSSYRDLESKHENLVKENRKLRDDLKTYYAIVQEKESLIEQCNTENSNLNSKLKDHDIELENKLKSQTEEFKKESDASLTKYNALMTRYNDLLRTHVNCATEIDEIKNIYANLENTNNDQNTKMKHYISTLENEKRELEAKITTLIDIHSNEKEEYLNNYNQLRDSIKRLFKELFPQNIIPSNERSLLGQIGSFVEELQSARMTALNYINDKLTQPQINLIDAIKAYLADVNNLFHTLKDELPEESFSNSVQENATTILAYIRKLNKYFNRIFKSFNIKLGFTENRKIKLTIDEMYSHLKTAAEKIKQLEDVPDTSKCERPDDISETRKRESNVRKKIKYGNTKCLLDLVWSFNRVLIYRYFELLYDHGIKREAPKGLEHFVTQITKLQNDLNKPTSPISSIYRSFILNELNLVSSVITEKEFKPAFFDQDLETFEPDSSSDMIVKMVDAMKENVITYLENRIRLDENNSIIKNPDVQ